MENQTVYTVQQYPTMINMKVEKNSRGFNYEITIQGAKSIEEAFELLTSGEAKLNEKYGGTNG